MSYSVEERINRIHELLEEKELSNIEMEEYLRRLDSVLYRLNSARNDNEVRAVYQDIESFISLLDRKPDKKRDIPSSDNNDYFEEAEYIKIYNANKEKYNSTERAMLEHIFSMLSEKELSDEEKQKYENKIIDILKKLNAFDPQTKEILDGGMAYASIKQEIESLMDELDRLPFKDKKTIPDPIPDPVPKPIPDPIPDPVPDPTPGRDTVEDDIKKFMSLCDKLRKTLEKVQKSLILSQDLDLNLNDEIRGITSEVKEIEDSSKELINEIDEFKNKKLYNNANFSMSVAEIKRIVSDFQRRVRELKVNQIHKYNARVNAANEKINKLKGMTGLDEETMTLINELELLDTCNAEGIRWNSVKYLDTIKYNKLIETLTKIDEIEKKANISKEKNSYDEELDYIEKELDEIESKIVEGLSLDDANKLKDNLQSLDKMLDDLTVRINNDENVNVMDYMERIAALKTRILDLRKRIDEILKNNGLINDYRLLEERIFEVFTDINHVFEAYVPLIDNFNEETLASLITKLDECETVLDEIEKLINESHDQGRLDDKQYEQLNIRMKETRRLLNSTREIFKNPNRVKDGDVFGSLNGRIDGLKEAIDKLEVYVDSLAAPIKDKEVRKNIDKTIERLENEVRTIRNYLEEYKDKEPEKYEEASKRLDEQEERLAEIAKKYRKKCPFLVKTVKSAKEFYKKHKKAVLIAAGLAAIALIHATLGPIIIPAIMHGNLMIMHTAPALRGTFMAINSVLGKAINAQIINNIWTLANGVTIAPYCASASLLKGIAIAGMGTAAIVGPLVVAAKNLINKMHMAELKKKMTEKAEKVKEKTEKTKEKAKEKIKKAKEKIKKTNDKTVVNPGESLDDMYMELYEQCEASGLTIEEFCSLNGIPDEIKQGIIEISNKKAGGRSGR